MSHKTLEQCKSGKHFISYGVTHGGTIARQNGSHVIIETPKGGVVVPYHGNQNLPPGTRYKIIKAFLAIGISVILIVYVLSNMGIV